MKILDMKRSILLKSFHWHRVPMGSSPENTQGPSTGLIIKVLNDLQQIPLI